MYVIYTGLWDYMQLLTMSNYNWLQNEDDCFLELWHDAGLYNRQQACIIISSKSLIKSRRVNL